MSQHMCRSEVNFVDLILSFHLYVGFQRLNSELVRLMSMLGQLSEFSSLALLRLLTLTVSGYVIQAGLMLTLEYRLVLNMQSFYPSQDRIPV